MNGYHDPTLDGPSGSSLPAQIDIPVGPTNQARVLVRSLNNQEAVFHLSGVETAYANSLRRVMMAEVPTVSKCLLILVCRPALTKIAIDQVQFHQNTSPLPDELLA
jgi:DNA-directed RNA polymerase II subunit RPB3